MIVGSNPVRDTFFLRSWPTYADFRKVAKILFVLVCAKNGHHHWIPKSRFYKSSKNRSDRMWPKKVPILPHVFQGWVIKARPNTSYILGKNLIDKYLTDHSMNKNKSIRWFQTRTRTRPVRTSPFNPDSTEGTPSSYYTLPKNKVYMPAFILYIMMKTSL